MAAVGVLTILAPYRLTRLMNFRNPFADSQGAGYQLVQSLLALGSGGVTGQALGNQDKNAFIYLNPIQILFLQ